MKVSEFSNISLCVIYLGVIQLGSLDQAFYFRHYVGAPSASTSQLRDFPVRYLPDYESDTRLTDKVATSL